MDCTPRPVSFCECGNHAWAALTKGFVTLVDVADADVLATHRWNAQGKPVSHYAARGGWKSKRIWLHRQLCGDPNGLVDHINRNTLDNRRANLRPAGFRENSWNRRGFGKSGFKGVYKDGRRFRATIFVHGRHLQIGHFSTAEEAAAAYDKVAARLRGEWAVLNSQEAERV